PLERVTARYGYHLESARSTRYSHVYWREVELIPSADGNFVIPAEISDRPILLKADESNGIADIELGSSESGSAYDLLGRKVVNPARGLYIRNGNKTIIR
ncbi:MAG: hypothetical protein K2N10_04595, partial [Muribaculaceae bacterium]|nr:hypothetical protein [Muribaculaceae bacterium]